MRKNERFESSPDYIWQKRIITNQVIGKTGTGTKEVNVELPYEGWNLDHVNMVQLEKFQGKYQMFDLLW